MGFFVDLPEHRKKPVPEFVGPIVRLGVCDSKSWSAVVFVASKHRHVELQWSIEGQHGAEHPQPESLGSAGGWHFFRWQLQTAVQKSSQKVVYELTNAAKKLTECIAVPGAAEDWHVMAYSCYDQRRAVGEALWHDVSRKSKTQPYHVILGGGDQLYNDNVWALEVLDKWLHQGKDERTKTKPSKEMVDAVEDYYLQSYLSHTHYHAAAELLRHTPQVNTWDDHDTFDGWGSYPKDIQLCPVFQMVFQQSQRFYLLFQQATTPQHAAQDGFLVNPGRSESEASAFHYLSQLGPSMLVVAPDSRSQRSREHILTEESYKRIEVAMQSMAPTTKHVLLLSAIPIVYPSLGVLETALKAFDNAGNTTQKLLFKTGLYDKIYNAFDTPDLLDDVTDHWSSGPHEKEKSKLLTMFHKLAQQHRVRVTIVSGDVHLGAFTYLRGKDSKSQATDPGFMPQIVTSGIGNNPPDDFVVKYIASCGRKPRFVTPELKEYVGRLFKTIKTRTGSEGFNNRMNYVDLQIKDVDGRGTKGLAFSMTFLGGDPIKGDEIGDVVDAVVPPLMNAGAKADALEMEACIAEKPKLFRCLCC